jgi:phosphoribosylaminoimidazolecarboxamide formyltransferase / IMP cyclohydrolase
MKSFVILSVFNKKNIDTLAIFLIGKGYHILSTGGTYQYLKDKNIPVTQVSNFTKYPEILNGRVKTLHPDIYGGILGYRTNGEELKGYIDIVVVNLYPFKEVISKEHTLNDAIENIDIGGVSLLRAGAKNYHHVVSLTHPDDYQEFIINYDNVIKDDTLRLDYAKKSLHHVTNYDIEISQYFNPKKVYRQYEVVNTLKYGCNPHQPTANILSIDGITFPYQVINGKIGYINYLDAILSWQLVNELSIELDGIHCCTSFKHNAPAGVGTSRPLSELLSKCYMLKPDVNYSDATISYIRARNADPMSSFGDFVAISHTVDESLALYLKTEVSDGIIAPDYTPEALEILKQKKKGNFIIVKGVYPTISTSNVSYREMFGVALSQEDGTVSCCQNIMGETVVTNKDFLNNNIEAIHTDYLQDLKIANVTCKYTPSNSVVFAYDGQVVGVGSGQQNRVDCVKLAGRKAETWFLRQHPKTLALLDNFKAGMKRQSKVNDIVTFITTQRYTQIQYDALINNQDNEILSVFYPDHSVVNPIGIPQNEKNKFMNELKGVVVSSDAFFPFPDSIDECVKYGVSYIVQPGGSVVDNVVIKSCDDYGISMFFTGVRLFLH